MSKFELKLPQMGESVAEATLTSWLKEVGDTIEMDEAIFEIATDKVDSEVPSEVEGKLLEKRFEVDDVIKVGEVVAVIEMEGSAETSSSVAEEDILEIAEPVVQLENEIAAVKESVTTPVQDFSGSNRFYSPLVKNIAKQEGISVEELDAIPGTGKEGRVTKNDILSFIGTRGKNGGEVHKNVEASQIEPKSVDAPPVVEKTKSPQPVKTSIVEIKDGDEKNPFDSHGQAHCPAYGR